MSEITLWERNSICSTSDHWKEHLPHLQLPKKVKSLSPVHCGLIWNCSNMTPPAREWCDNKEWRSNQCDRTSLKTNYMKSSRTAADKCFHKKNKQTCKHRRWKQDLSGNTKQWDTLKQVGSLISSHTVSSHEKNDCTCRQPTNLLVLLGVGSDVRVQRHWAPGFHFIQLEILVLQ